MTRRTARQSQWQGMYLLAVNASSFFLAHLEGFLADRGPQLSRYDQACTTRLSQWQGVYLLSGNA